MTINRDQASRFGISAQLIDDTLYDAYGQRQVTQYYTQLNTSPVILEITPELQNELTSLEHIYVKSPVTGGVVPLTALVDIDSNKVGPACDHAPGAVSTAGHAGLQSPAGRCARPSRRCRYPGGG